jgi:uncharacterized surface anchored protein
LKHLFKKSAAFMLSALILLTSLSAGLIVGAAVSPGDTAYLSTGYRCKQGSDTGTTNGIGFKVKDLSADKWIKQHINYPVPVDIDIFYTAAGKLMLPEPLPYGEYELVEVQTAQGYVLDSTPVKFKVDGSKKVITVEKHNIAQKGKISIKKTGEIFSTVEENGSFHKPKFEEKGLSGAAFEIYAAADIITPDGTVRAQKGEIVDTLTTDASGTATSKDLYLGKYEIREITAPDGMVLSTEPVPIELSYAGQEVAVTQSFTSIYNERQKLSLSLTKELEQDESFHLGMNSEILDVRFGLFAAEDIIAADSSKIPANALIEIVSPEQNGSVNFKTDLPFGKYFVQEIAANEAYIISGEKYFFTFGYEGSDVPLVKIVLNGEKPIQNELLRGKIKGVKLDEAENPLPKAVFGLFHYRSMIFTKDNAILTATSDENGAFAFENVPYGCWVVAEIEPPEGYVLGGERFYVDIDKNEKLIEISLKNRRIYGNVQLTKVDAEYPQNKLVGAVFEVFDKGGKLVGEMKSIIPGIYVLQGLPFCEYSLKEKVAPEGFILDENTYDFAIKTDGETVIVENKAGVGFINQPKKGKLEFTKKDVSTGALIPDCGVRIKDEWGNIVVEGRTDENGKIVFDLRVGKYTHSEFDAPKGYILDTREFPFEIKENGEIIKAVMTNKKIPKKPSVPDNPKTGDGFNPLLPSILAGGSLSGVGGLTLFKRRKRRIKSTKRGV